MRPRTKTEPDKDKKKIAQGAVRFWGVVKLNKIKVLILPFLLTTIPIPPLLQFPFSLFRWST